MVLLLIGPPGCDKGTQSPLLRAKLGIPAISTGDMLRQENEKQSDTGRLEDGLLANGRLVPDDIVNVLLKSRLAVTREQSNKLHTSITSSKASILRLQ